MNLNTNIIQRVIQVAYKSPTRIKMAACLLRNNRLIGSIQTNQQNRIMENKKVIHNCGHAERQALKCNGFMPVYTGNLLRRNKYYNRKNKLKLKPNSVLVIRVSDDNPEILQNARPCRSCLENIKSCHFKYVYYSNEHGRIIRENISFMLSIKDSIFSKKLFQNQYNYPSDPKEYFKITLQYLNKSLTDLTHLNIFLELIKTYKYNITYCLDGNICHFYLDDEPVSYILII